MENIELDHVMGLIRQKYSVETVPMKIGDKVLKILQLQDFEEYVKTLIEEKGAKIGELPFWGKVWDASLLLAYFMGKQPVVFGQHILEIGAGMGIVGIYAALCGHQVTLSDNNEDALLFARANALLNDVPQVQVRLLDWTAPDLPQGYDIIVGSEVVYDRPSYPSLVRFLRRALAPGGMIFLAKNRELKASSFFEELTKVFELKENIQKVRTNEESLEIALYAIRPKRNLTVAETITG